MKVALGAIGKAAAAAVCAMLLHPCAPYAQQAHEALPPFELVQKDGDHEGIPQVVAGAPHMAGNWRREGLWRHAGSYPRFHVAWRRDRRMGGVERVFPHPLLPRRALLAAAGKLLQSDDGGRTWRRLAGWQGAVQSVAFNPLSSDAFQLASAETGVWSTSDGGRTFSRTGTTEAGAASNETIGVYYYPADRRLRTLLAVHGDAAPGLSLSEDGGRTWRVIARGYHIHQVLCGAAGDLRLFLIAAKTDAPEALSVHTCHSVGEPWYEVVRDVMPTDMAASVIRGPAYVATSDAGLLQLTHAGAAHSPVGPAPAPRWASVGVTWDSHADRQLVYAYAPAKLGMVVSTDGMKTFTAHSRGLFTGPFVREGAHIRANANGALFYAVVNRALYRGLRLADLRVAQVDVEPATLSFASKAYRTAQEQIRDALTPLARSDSVLEHAEQITIHAQAARAALPAADLQVTAKVVGARAPKQVTVDLSRVAGSPRTAMAPTPDGLYSCRIPLDPAGFDSQSHDWRRRWPGRLALSVSAASQEGALAGAVGLLFLSDRPETFSWRSDFRYRQPREPVRMVAFEGSDDTVAKRRRWTALKLTVGPGEWEVALGDAFRTVDVTGYYALGFWIKTTSTERHDLRVQLRDNPDYVMATVSKPARLLADGFVSGQTLPNEYCRVVLPLRRLVRDTAQLQTRLLGFVVLSGDAPHETTYWIDDLRFYLTEEDLEADRRQLAADE